MMFGLEVFFFFLPLLGIASLPLGVAVIALDSLLYSKWVPAMRAQMSTRKWPAVVIGFSPLLLFPSLTAIQKRLPPAISPFLSSPWSIVFGCTFCVAFAACWLKLPREDDQDPNAPPARSLTGEWLLAVGILAANYVLLRLLPEF